jgi:hypothetical protein
MKGLLTVIWLLSVLTPGLVAADDLSATRERTRQTLLYGIDSQVLDAVKSLKASKDSSFTRELAQILTESLSVDVRVAVLDLFQDQKVKDGEGKA